MFAVCLAEIELSISCFGSLVPISARCEREISINRQLQHNTQEYFAKLSVCVAVSVAVTGARRLFSDIALIAAARQAFDTQPDSDALLG